MNTLILKKPDGTIERFVGKKGQEVLKRLPITEMTLECMFGGIPFPMPEGGYVIEQEGLEYLVDSFINSV